MRSPTLDELDQAAGIVYRTMPPTPQYQWPQLNDALGTEAWIKHENHAPLSTFKVRGALLHLARLSGRPSGIHGVVTAGATNHAAAVAFAAQRHAVQTTIVVPQGTGAERTAPLRSLGVHLVEHGCGTQQAWRYAHVLAARQQWHLVPTWHSDLVAGAASGWLELLRAAPDLDVIFAPIGHGVGICAAVAARQALGAQVRIIGVVSTHAPTYKRSFEAGQPVPAPASTVLGDAMRYQVPAPGSLSIILSHVDDIVTVTDNDLARAMRLLFRTTHNVAEGAGAAALAAALKLKDTSCVAGRRLGLPVTGANVDAMLFRRVLVGD